VKIPPPQRILLAMLGARLHYMTPRTLAEAGVLESFHTDICAAKGSGRLMASLIPAGVGPRGLRRLRGRIPDGIPTERIHTHELLGWKYALRRTRPLTARQAAELHLAVGKKFCNRVIQSGFGAADSVFVYNTAALEISREARKRGLPVLHEQTIPPKNVELELLGEEFEKYPEIQYARRDDGAWKELIDREIEELQIADLILCGSEFVKQTIVRQGVDPDRVLAVPNTALFQPPPEDARRNRPKDQLRVLFVGEVGLRKGAHYLVEALRALESEGVVGRFVGTVAFTQEYRSKLPKNVEFTGAIPRAEMLEQFLWADVFSLPSLCEGSPIAICEALASGLPVITTPHADSIVRDGHNGRVVPIRDSVAIIEAIRSLKPADYREQLGHASLKENPPPYSPAAYTRNLLGALGLRN